MRTVWFASFVSMAALSQAQFSTAFVDGYLLTKNFGYLVSAPRMVTSESVRTVVSSPNGRYAMVYTLDTKGQKLSSLTLAGKKQGRPVEPKLYVYDANKDSMTRVNVPTELAAQSIETQFTSDNKAAYIVAYRESPANAKEPGSSYGLIRIGLDDASYKEIYRSPESKYFAFGSVTCSPTKPLIALTESIVVEDPKVPQVRSTALTIRLFDNLGNPIKKCTKKLESAVYPQYQWLEDGKNMVLIHSVRDHQTQQIKQIQSVYDSTTNEISETHERFNVYQKPENIGEFIAETTAAQLASDKAKENVRPLWLRSMTETEQANCLVSADCDSRFFLADENRKIIYIANTRMYVCDIEQVDRQAILDHLEMMKRAVAMSNAKQIAVAMLIFTSDNDDKFPGQAGWQDTIRPYVKNDELFSGFNYTYSGGTATSIQDPSGTQLGYVSVTGGRVVAFVDGHVKFIPDK